MARDTNFLKKLLETFKVELDEKLQTMIDALLNLEHSQQDPGLVEKNIDQVFRDAHNIKGSSRTVGVNDVGEIAHQIESLFAAIRTKQIQLSNQVISVCILGVDGMRAAMDSYYKQIPLPFDLNALLEQLKEGQPSPNFVINKPYVEKGRVASSSMSSEESYESIRVSLHQIEHVSTLLEELQINKIVIDDHYSALVKLSVKADQLSSDNPHTMKQISEVTGVLSSTCKNLHHSMNEISTVLNSLQEHVRMLRLIPASSILRDIRRSVRELASDLNKKIDLHISGDSIKLDKIILEGLKDPLIHILRNAIDHGIEEAQTRQKRGKPEEGQISIQVLDEGDQIFINILDDGGGIDYTKIAEVAEKKGIVSQAELETMEPNDIVELIFTPGFSTKDIVTNVSGRGVGLDVVKSNLANIRGEVSVITDPGTSTLFQLRVPLTLSSDLGIIIRSAGQLFIIPTSSIEHMMLLERADILNVIATQAILFKNKPILLRKLSDILSLDVPSDASLLNHYPIVILKKEMDIVALLVDEILEEREIVIKPLSPPLVNIKGISGGALCNAQVILVLNTTDIIQLALEASKERLVVAPEVETEMDLREHILLVDDSITTRTLEKNILENNNYKVTLAVDGKNAWELLQKNTYSLLITDIEMPNMTGLELTSLVKKSPNLSNLPVIIVTSLGSEEQKKHGMEVGADAYIVKHDFESKELLDVIAQLV